MMDRISSSPSIDDGGFSFLSCSCVWSPTSEISPACSSSMSLVPAPTSESFNKLVSAFALVFAYCRAAATSPTAPFAIRGLWSALCMTANATPRRNGRSGRQARSQWPSKFLVIQLSSDG
jgi:hypothetical protein